MNDYIINPFIIYLIGTLGTLNIILTMIAAISGLAAVVLFFVELCYFGDYEDDDCDPTIKKMNKACKTCFITCIISTLVAVFIPSVDTLYAMIAASLATKTNVTLTVEGIKDLIDYIAEVVASTNVR